jgi:hypothetical protein
MKVTVPLPLTVPVCPGANVTEMWAPFVFPDRLTVVLPLELATPRLTAAVALFASVKEVGLADNVQAPVVGVGLGVGSGVGVGTGVGVGVGLQLTPWFAHGVGVG